MVYMNSNWISVMVIWPVTLRDSGRNGRIQEAEVTSLGQKLKYPSIKWAQVWGRCHGKSSKLVPVLHELPGQCWTHLSCPMHLLLTNTYSCCANYNTPILRFVQFPHFSSLCRSLSTHCMPHFIFLEYSQTWLCRLFLFHMYSLWYNRQECDWNKVFETRKFKNVKIKFCAHENRFGKFSETWTYNLQLQLNSLLASQTINWANKPLKYYGILRFISREIDGQK